MKTKIAGLLGVGILCTSFLFAGFVVGTSTLIARAAACAVPYTFVNGTPADANQVNSNFSALVACFSTIDNTNIGPAGIYASQIIPTNTSQATFGSSQTYGFPSGLIPNTGNSSGTLTSTGSVVCGMVGGATAFEFVAGGTNCVLGGDKATQEVGVGGNLDIVGLIAQEGAGVNIFDGALELDGLGGPTLTGSSTNLITSSGAIVATTSASGVAGALSPCFTPAGAACGGIQTQHVVNGTLTTTTSGSCTTGTICALASTGSVTFTGAAVYTSSTTWSCSGNDVDNSALANIIPASGTGFVSDILNLSGGTISNGTAVSIQYHCSGH